MDNKKPKSKKKKRFTCYAVFRGRKPGVYRKWADVIKQTDRFEKPYCKGYYSLLVATKAFNRYQGGVGNRNQEKLTPKKYDHVWDRNYFENEQIKETPTYYPQSPERKRMTKVEDNTSASPFPQNDYDKQNSEPL